MAEGTILPLQDTKQLAELIIANVVPKGWKKFTVYENVGLANWIKDFKNRITQLEPLPENNDW